MRKLKITPPTELAVDLAAAKANMRIDFDDLDDQVTDWIQGVVAKLEHDINFCLMPQTWQVTLSSFYEHHPLRHVEHDYYDRVMWPKVPGAITLPHPAMAIKAVTYLDQTGTEQILDAAKYRIVHSEFSSTLLPARGFQWPFTVDDAEAVVVIVDCGVGPDSSATPANLKLYILGKLVQQFDPASLKLKNITSNTVQAQFLEGLLEGSRSYAQ